MPSIWAGPTIATTLKKKKNPADIKPLLLHQALSHPKNKKEAKKKLKYMNFVFNIIKYLKFCI